MKKRVHTHQLIGLAACTFEVLPGVREIQLFPAGLFRASDGRPQDAPAWRIDAAIAVRIIERVAARANPLVIDYEHQTLNAEQNGQAAPAAGWFKHLEWREGQGLFATDVEWTEKAAQMIAAKEYRFISPVFPYGKRTGEVLDLFMAALTNYPGIDGMADLTARAAARFAFDSDPSQQEDHPMNEALLALLGLKPGATEEQINQAVAALKAKLAAAETQEQTIVALRAQVERPDPAKYVPVATVQALQSEVAALKADLTKREINDLIEPALADGRLLPAMENWARELGGKDIAALKSYLDTAQPIDALKGTQTRGKAPEGGKGGELTDADIAVCKQMGIDPEEYKKTKGQG